MAIKLHKQTSSEVTIPPGGTVQLFVDTDGAIRTKDENGSLGGSVGGITGSAGGDLDGTYPDPTVAKVNGVSVSGTPTSGQILTATSATAATWQTGGDDVADGIASTGEPITISLTPPNPGDVLTATDATRAGWSAPSGGGSRTIYVLPSNTSASGSGTVQLFSTPNSFLAAQTKTLVTFYGVANVPGGGGWVGVNMSDNGGGGMSGLIQDSGFVATGNNKGPGDPAGDSTAGTGGGGGLMFARFRDSFSGPLAVWGYRYVQLGDTSGKLDFLINSGGSAYFLAGLIVTAEVVP